MILAGDVGGTKCNLALLEKKEATFDIVHLGRYPTENYAHFYDLLAHFLRDVREIIASSQAGKVLAAGFGVAGPVIRRSVHLTNLSWDLDADALERQTGARRVVLLNDLEATGYCLPWVRPGDYCTLNAGKPAPQAAQVVIAAGTGLGEAILFWNGARYVVSPSEGGHADLSPRNEKEIELLRYLQKTNPHVSFELVLSGRGFHTLHEFLDPAVRHPGFDSPGFDPAPEITRMGLEGSCPVCVETLDLFTALYGAEAGNLALKALARGGVYIAGGIAPKILPKLQTGAFMRSFCAKEKFETLLVDFPVHVLLDEHAPLLGAAAEAARAAAV